MAYVSQHLANADVAIIEGRYQRALNEFKKAEEFHPDERSKNGIREAERLIKEKRDDRELGTGLYHIGDKHKLLHNFK